MDRLSIIVCRSTPVSWIDPSLANHVKGGVLSTIALLMKLSWMEECDVQQVNLTVIKLLQENMVNGLMQQLLGLQLMKSIINEYSSTRNLLGLPSEFHHQCRLKFQEHCLLVFFEQTLNLLSQLQPKDETSMDLIHLSLTTCDAILSWNYRGLEQGESRTSDAVYLPQEWSRVILVPQCLQLFFQMTDSFFDNPRMSIKPLSCLVHLSGIHGPVFNPTSQAQYVNYYLTGFSAYIGRVLNTINSPNAPDDVGDKIFSASQMASHLFCHFPLTSMVSLPVFQQVLNHLGHLTILCLKANPDDLDESWLMEAGDEFLLLWATLVEKLEFSNSEDQSKLRDPALSSFVASFVQIASGIVDTYITHRIELASRTDVEEEDDDFMKDSELYEDQLVNITTLARLSAKDLLNHLRLVIEEKRNEALALMNGPPSTLDSC